MGDHYFMSGYTGFCPGMSQRVGQNYSECTRDAIRERPHMRSRLGGVRWRQVENGDVSFNSGDGYECVYNPAPSDLSTSNSCASFDEERNNAGDPRCPLKAYPLSCSDYGSQCLDKCCDDECCHNRYHNGENCKFIPPPMNCQARKCQSSSMSTPCCSSISKDSFVCGSVKDRSHKPNNSSMACCISCGKGDQCEGGGKQYFIPVKLLNSCCSCKPCVKSDPSDKKKQYSQSASSKPSCASYSSEPRSDIGRKSETTVPSCYQYSFRNIDVKPYRTCGVIPNYMGYIPGMQMTFGEPYGITANRLLRRQHFSDQNKNNFKSIA